MFIESKTSAQYYCCNKDFDVYYLPRRLTPASQPSVPTPNFSQPQLSTEPTNDDPREESPVSHSNFSSLVSPASDYNSAVSRVTKKYVTTKAVSTLYMLKLSTEARVNKIGVPFHSLCIDFLVQKSTIRERRTHYHPCRRGSYT